MLLKSLHLRLFCSAVIIFFFIPLYSQDDEKSKFSAGWHSLNKTDSSDRFRICNLGIGTTRTIKVTELFSIPVNGQVVFNPDTERLYVVVGFTL